MAEFEAFADEMKQRLDETAAGSSSSPEKPIIAANWGHIMDGNLHFNVTTPGHFDVDPTVLNALEPYIFECVIRKGGSISAEHGLGQAKHKYLPMVHDPVTLRLMHSVKEMLDPRGIMNPGKYLPQP
ncbi:Probable D-2-hydroxyglutarate dehydrogenase, mitochondrial [Seminavis robusta]|uniref:Probable D-2-hydroxyglutarate dehydrogenase, mitochondrial n=1 Tax=Seminavis robusta TaxID=568900 RepID=A0A9N8EDN5_9STRA|nr:Probable D-2-hydroxyglutarate dehydrogenase, mitochondrial [Seminavis robusta]|eukprot:Sro1024_g232630.1 Probable D-2-hydroxyglutarate dehydrogenase, mitochondrial (127) ;mRNA; r:15243-15623